MRRFRVPLFVLVVLALAGCGATPEPTPDAVATQVAVEEAAAATLTAKAPTETNTPSATPTSTHTRTPTRTPTRTSTPTRTLTPTPTATPSRTPAPTATPTSTPVPWVSFDSEEFGISLEYPDECEVSQVDSSGLSAICSKWYLNLFVFDRADDPVMWTGPHDELPETFARILLSQVDVSLDDDMILISERTPDGFGVPAFRNRYESENHQVRLEVLTLVAHSRMWSVLMMSLDPDYEPWSDKVEDSLAFKIPPTPTPKPTKKPKPKATKAPTPAPQLAQIGEQVQAGDWLLTVTDVQYHKALYFYGDPTVAMGVYSVLFITAQNQASGTTHFGTLWWELHGAKGQVYDDDSETFDAAWQFGGKDTPWDDVDPGQVIELVMAFDVADGAKGLQLYSYKLKKPFVYIGDAQPPQDLP